MKDDCDSRHSYFDDFAGFSVVCPDLGGENLDNFKIEGDDSNMI